MTIVPWAPLATLARAIPWKLAEWLQPAGAGNPGPGDVMGNGKVGGGFNRMEVEHMLDGAGWADQTWKKNRFGCDGVNPHGQLKLAPAILLGQVQVDLLKVLELTSDKCLLTPRKPQPDKNPQDILPIKPYGFLIFSLCHNLPISISFLYPD